MLIHYVEDDAQIAAAVREYLEGRGFALRVFDRAADAQAALMQTLPSLMLVDWNLPDGQGSALCHWIRARWAELPLILLTVRGDARDVVHGLSQGADDYITKPFELSVLEARIRALLRRAGRANGGELICGNLRLDPARGTASLNGAELRLSPPEYRLLRILLENRGRTVARRQLLEEIWDSAGCFVNDNTLTVAVKRLREKLNNPAWLVTVRSFGYRAEDDV